MIIIIIIMLILNTVLNRMYIDLLFCILFIWQNVKSIVEQ